MVLSLHSCRLLRIRQNIQMTRHPCMNFILIGKTDACFVHIRRISAQKIMDLCHK